MWPVACVACYWPAIDLHWSCFWPVWPVACVAYYLCPVSPGMLRGRHFRQAFCSRRHFRQLTHKQFRQLIIRGAIGKLKDKTPKFLKIKIIKPIQQVHFTIYTSMPKRCTPKRCIPEKCTLKRCTPERYTPKRYTPKKYTPRKCTPRRCTPRRCISRR